MGRLGKALRDDKNYLRYGPARHPSEATGQATGRRIGGAGDKRQNNICGLMSRYVFITQPLCRAHTMFILLGGGN